MKNIYRHKGFKYDKRYGHITIRGEDIKCKDEYEFVRIIDKWCIDNIMTKEESIKYRGSNEWKALRNKILTKNHNTCKMCGIKKKGLQVHHALERKSYGCENENDLFPLCSACHKEVSRILKRSRNKIDLVKYCENLKKIIKRSHYY